MMNAELQPVTIQKLGSAAYFSFAMLAGMQLDLFTPLGAGPMSAKRLSDVLCVRESKLVPLLYALVAAGLLIIEDGMFANTAEGDRFLVKGKPTFLGARHAFYTARYEEIQQTAASIRTGSPQAKLDFASMTPMALEAYLRSLHPATLAAGLDLSKRFDFSSHKHLLDVGGGSGGVSLAIAEACPELHFTVLELPSVTPITQRFIDQADMTGRANVLAQDVINGSLTDNYDVAVLRAFIQVLSPDEALYGLRNIHMALEPGSPVYIIGRILDDSRLSPPETVAFNLIFINIYTEGQAYTENEYRGWLTEAGFVGIERYPLAGGESLMLARKPD